LSKLPGCALLLTLSFGCLPKDTRPPPSRVRFTASPSADTQAGRLATETADGWAITFERVLISIGRASLDGDRCSVYSDADYGRVLSLIGGPDRQKISEGYALGTCDFGFGIGNASADSLLGVGTTSDDFDFLRTAGSDRYGGPSGISLFVAGRAKKAAQGLSFAWAFRGRARYRECENTVDGVVERGLSLEQDGDVTVDVTLHAEALFAEDLAARDSALRFDPIASADALGDGDGDVSLEELSLVPLSDLRSGTAYAQNDANPTPVPLSSLEDFIYVGAAPNVARYQETGKCNLRLPDAPGN
jgi:hypothetical protein